MWGLISSEEQEMIANSVDQFLASELPLDRLRPNARAIDEVAVWATMAGLGWFGIGIAEPSGGLGLGLAEEMLVQHGCGRHLVSPSVLATVLAAHIAEAANDKTLVGEFVEGRRRAALAIVEGGSDILGLDWQGNDMLVLWNGEGAGLFGPGDFENARPEQCIDDSLAMHRGAVDLARARHWIPASQAPIGLRAEALLAALLAGLAEGACALATDYAKLREQFGRPIGSFQAIKHRCADMLVRAETSRHLTTLACLKLDCGAADAPLQVAAAKLKAAHAAHENGRAVIQVHGGLGFQSECDAHWFMKRAHVYDQAGGNAQIQAKRVFTAASPLWL